MFSSSELLFALEVHEYAVTQGLVNFLSWLRVILSLTVAFRVQSPLGVLIMTTVPFSHRIVTMGD